MIKCTVYNINQESYDQIISAGKVLNDFVRVMSKDFKEDMYRYALMSQGYFKEFMKKKLTLSQTQDSVRDLYNMHCYMLHQIDKSSEFFKAGTRYQKSIEALSTAKLMLHNAVSHIWDAQDEELDKNIDFFSDVQSENKFMSSWSYYELFHRDQINEKCDLTFNSITYNGKEYKTDKFKEGHSMTWLALWAYLDEVMRMSGDGHHVFIESLEDLKNGSFEMHTGS